MANNEINHGGDTPAVKRFEEQIHDGAFNSISSEVLADKSAWDALKTAAKHQTDYTVTEGVDKKGNEYIDFGHTGLFSTVKDAVAGKHRVIH